MENTREEEEEKLHYNTLNYKMEMKTTLKLCISSLGNPRGVFIATREEGGQGTNPGPKRRARRGRMAAETRPSSGRARGALSRAQSFLSPVSS